MARPGFSFLICPDSLLVRKRLDKLLAACDQGSPWIRKVYWADEDELPAAFWQDLTVPGLLAENRAVILRRAQALKEADWKKFSPVLSGFSEYVWPFFCLEGQWSKKGPSIPKSLEKQKFFQFAQKQKWVWTSPGLTRNSMIPLLGQWAEAKELSFDPGVKDRLARSLPLDAWAVDAELSKIELAAGENGRVTGDHVDLVTFHEDMETFDFLSALERGDDAAGIWREVFVGRFSDKNLIFMFIGALIYESRNLWRLLVGDVKGLRLPPYLRQGKKALAEKLGADSLARIWDLALEAEMGIKTGRVKPDQALEALVAGLSNLFRTCSGRRG